MLQDLQLPSLGMFLLGITFFLAVDTTAATADNRLRLYVNGSEITVFTTTVNPTQNTILTSMQLLLIQ
jgi:hypothetical protein